MSQSIAIRIVWAFAAVLPTHAHFTLLQPPSIHSVDNGGKGAPPCGEAPDSNVVTPAQGGRPIQLRIREFIFHPGHYRVALSVKSRAELPPDPEVTQDANGISISAVIQSPVKVPVLADGLFAHTAPLSGEVEASIVLPNLDCDRCTLQVIEFMADHGFNDGGGYYYHHCADLRITADPSLPPADPAWPGAAVAALATFPHVAAAGGWSTVLNFLNPTATSIPATVIFHSRDQTVVPQSLVLPPNGTVILSPSDDAWAEVRSVAPIEGYALYRYTPPDGPISEAVAALKTPSTALSLPFDNSAGSETTFVMANPAAADSNWTATVFDENGMALLVQSMPIAAATRVTFTPQLQFPQTANRRGYVRFQGAAISGISLRSTPAGSFVVLPSF